MSAASAAGAPVAGLVLAGGKSSRLGRDKARIKVDGKDLLCRAVNLLESVVGQVWVAGRDPSGHGLHNPWFMDDIPGKGPVGGILTALRKLQRPCLVTSCDLPFLDQPTLLRLLRARDAAHASVLNGRPPLMTTYGQTETGYIEALVAVYEPDCLPRLETAVAQGRHKLSAIIPRDCRTEIPYSKDDAMVFFNINRPADLAVLRRLEGSTWSATT